MSSRSRFPIRYRVSQENTGLLAGWPIGRPLSTRGEQGYFLERSCTFTCTCYSSDRRRKRRKGEGRMRLAGIVPNGRNFNFETLIYSHLDSPSESSKVVSSRLLPPCTHHRRHARTSSTPADDTGHLFEGLNRSFHLARGFIPRAFSPSFFPPGMIMHMLSIAVI